MPRPVVALVGRPNVGKSTLFNRLAGQRLAVVDNRPGTTRDRLVAQAEWRGVAFDLVDTGGIDPTGGLRGEPLSLDSADYIDAIRSQAEIAVGGADAVLFLVDAMTGVTSADHEVADILRRAQGALRHRQAPPVLLVANRCDNPALRDQAVEFYELGLGDPHPVSALHGTGTGDLLDALFEALGPQALAQEETQASVRLALVGRPNVGKSSLLNRILGEERVIVSPIPGTTRDAIDTHLQAFGTQVTLIDTAGIRRRGHIEPGVEKYSVLRALRALERADVALLVTDATAGITAQDAHIAGMIVDLLRSVVVVVNKWDAVDKDSGTLEAYTTHVRQELSFLDYVPVLFVSARTGQRVGQVLPTALQVQEERLRRIATSDLNRMLREALDQHPPPAHAGQEVRLYFMAQIRSDPPTFAIQANDPKRVHFTYTRFLENRLRERYGFLGTPIRIVYRQHERTSRR